MRLLSKPLRELAADDLSKYYWKAMTTWGAVDDFKHFLPRFFELIVTDNITFDAFMIFDRLEYGKWETWSLTEIESIKSVIEAWWINSTLLNCQFDGGNFGFFLRALGSVEPLINNWDVSVDTNSFRNLIYFVFDNFQLYKIGKNIDEKHFKVLSNWIAAQAPTMEQGFYYYEKTEPDFAQTISYCYDIALRQHAV